MTELIKIETNDCDETTVSGRELHELLEVGSNYTTWFKRMCEYGFSEGIDFITCFPNLESEKHGGQNLQDHLLNLDMAKEICMIQRSEKGKEATLKLKHKITTIQTGSKAAGCILTGHKKVDYFFMHC